MKNFALGSVVRFNRVEILTTFVVWANMMSFIDAVGFGCPLGSSARALRGNQPVMRPWQNSKGGFSYSQNLTWIHFRKISFILLRVSHFSGWMAEPAVEGHVWDGGRWHLAGPHHGCQGRQRDQHHQESLPGKCYLCVNPAAWCRCYFRHSMSVLMSFHFSDFWN